VLTRTFPPLAGWVGWDDRTTVGWSGYSPPTPAEKSFCAAVCELRVVADARRLAMEASVLARAITASATGATLPICLQDDHHSNPKRRQCYTCLSVHPLLVTHVYSGW
jgi:hypothetical protein